MHRRTFFFVAGLAVVAAALFMVKVSTKMPDFDVYWRAGARAAAAEPLYRTEDEHYQFKYLPAFAMLAIPLGALDLPEARAAWFAASVALLGALLAIALRLLPERRKPAWVLVALTTVVLGKFYAHELVLGQVNLLFGVVVAGAVLAMRRGREIVAGVLVAFAIVLKPYGVVLLPWLVARQRPGSIVAASIGLTAALLLPVPIYGAEGTVALHRGWWVTVASTTAPNLLNPDNVSWLAMYTRWVGAGSVAGVLTLVTAVCAAGVMAKVWALRRVVAFPEGLEVGLLLVLIPFLSPQGWDYVLLIATPAVMLLINDDDRLPRILRWLTIAALAVIGLTIFDVMGAAAYRQFMLASGITLCFFVVIAAIVTLRVRRVA
jgi:hypothetical protein